MRYGIRSTYMYSSFAAPKHLSQKRAKGKQSVWYDSGRGWSCFTDSPLATSSGRHPMVAFILSQILCNSLYRACILLFNGLWSRRSSHCARYFLIWLKIGNIASHPSYLASAGKPNGPKTMQLDACILPSEHMKWVSRTNQDCSQG